MSRTRDPPIRPEDYAHSPAHYFVARGDHASLTRLVSTLPSLSDAHLSDTLSDRISAVVDTRAAVPHRETPLHLAVRLRDPLSVSILCSAGADASLQNSAGWNPIEEALCRKLPEIAAILVRHHHSSAWAKWRRRLPRVVAELRRMRDFYLEIQFHFESSFVPFIGKIAPSDTYRIWKRDGNLRADTTLAGFDGMKIQRADQSFLFLGEGDPSIGIPEGALLVLNRDERKIFDAFENAGAPMSDEDVASYCSQTAVYRPGMDVTQAELVGRTNWRRQEKTESVGEWKAKVYEINNVVFSFRTRKVSSSGGDNSVGGSGRREEQVLPLELDEEEDFLVAENVGLPDDNGRRHSSFVRDRKVEREWVSVGRKSVDINFAPAKAPARKSVDLNFAPARKSVDFNLAPVPERRRASSVTAAESVKMPKEPVAGPPLLATKEKEFVKSLRPTVWLTDQFPLKTEELLPLLDILANKVKAVRRMRELLTTKFPPGSFPVKIAIPVVPTVRVVITFTKFVPLQPTEQFYTPLSSPRFLNDGSSPPDEQIESRSSSSRTSSLSSASAWLRRNNSGRSSNKPHQQCPEALESDPFAIPTGYTWDSFDSKNRKVKKSKSVRKAK